ncbi:hypothetical protein BCR36DRAFT_409246 [Piromyces finnis]|uniref:Uncharacterized protein n=1 Tax=Piromyces finnis TaxID=1754191 RepID=A0A1Y1VJV6_9FUNG|nr:hypothetical protein BCR36DRAFT_409246 [Piromyces finnis]|eukprot:ORX57775.1 hypothetical protein BCR36DRAFT_409246 [Piromyces finnis]
MSDYIFYTTLNIKNTFYKNAYNKTPRHIENLKKDYFKLKKIIEKQNNSKNEAQGIIRIIYHYNTVYIDEKDEKKQKVNLKFSFQSIFKILKNPEISIVIVEDVNSFNCNKSEDLVRKFKEIHKNVNQNIKVVKIGDLKNSSITIPSNINTNKKEFKNGKQIKRNYALFIQLKADNICFISQPYTLMCSKRFSHTSETRKKSFFNNLLKDVENTDNINYYYNLIFNNQNESENKEEVVFNAYFNYKIKLFNIDKKLLLDNTDNKPTIKKIIDIIEILYNIHDNHSSCVNVQLSGTESLNQSSNVVFNKNYSNISNNILYQESISSSSFLNKNINNSDEVINSENDDSPCIGYDNLSNISLQSTFQTRNAFYEISNRYTPYFQSMYNENQEMLRECIKASNFINQSYHMSFISTLQFLFKRNINNLTIEPSNILFNNSMNSYRENEQKIFSYNNLSYNNNKY